MSKAKPATKPTAAALLTKCLRKRTGGLVIATLPADQFKIVVEMFEAHKNEPGKHSLRAFAAVLTEAFGTNITRNMVEAAYQEFKLGKLKKVT